MIAVTGAGGKTGLAIVQALAQRGEMVRGLVYKEEHRARVAAAGATESVVGNVADAATLQKLLAGVSALYHICPNMHPDEVAIGATILESAQAAGVQHLVYHSVLHPQTQMMPHHWHKLLVEERILASGLPFTILQPTAYMQNLLGYWQAIRNSGLYTVPYPVSTALSLVDVRDVAEVAARVLTEPGHTGAIYELVGTLPLTQSEVAARLSAHLGHAVTAAEMEIGQWERQARAQGLHEYAIQTLIRMFTYYAAYGLVGNPQVLTWLLGRAPTSLDAFIRETAEKESKGF
jgi:uncharacterized protein YbjT (DUF2867 family)